jgi:purine-nucleoside phosphorylase
MMAEIKQALKNNRLNYHEGVVWSTDAVYRETRAEVERHQEKGVLAVEMETSALFTVARFRNVEVGAILVVSDDLSSFKWQPGFKDSHFKQGREAACSLIKDLCQIL